MLVPNTDHLERFGRSEAAPRAVRRAAWEEVASPSRVPAQHRLIPSDAQRSMAARAGATTIEVKASHSVAVSHPATVTRFIERAAASATSPGDAAP